MAILGVVTCGYGSKIGKVSRIVDKAANYIDRIDNVRHTKDAINKADDILDSAKKILGSDTDKMKGMVDTLKNQWKSKKGKGPADDMQEILADPLELSDEARAKFRNGKPSQALDTHYEDLIKRKTGGETHFVDEGGNVLPEQLPQGSFEIDTITNTTFIQAKRATKSVFDNPENHWKKVKKQADKILELANKQNKKVEYWYKYGCPDYVNQKLQERGITVIEGLGN